MAKRLKLHPDLWDGQSYTFHSDEDGEEALGEVIMRWMSESEPGSEITIEVVEMSDEEFEALPELG